jgi:hypothetical protein
MIRHWPCYSRISRVRPWQVVTSSKLHYTYLLQHKLDRSTSSSLILEHDSPLQDGSSCPRVDWSVAFITTASHQGFVSFSSPWNIQLISIEPTKDIAAGPTQKSHGHDHLDGYLSYPYFRLRSLKFKICCSLASPLYQNGENCV